MNSQPYIGPSAHLFTPVASWIDVAKEKYFLSRPLALRFELDNRSTLVPIKDGVSNYHQLYKTHYGHGLAQWSSFRYTDPRWKDEFYVTTD